MPDVARRREVLARKASAKAAGRCAAREGPHEWVEKTHGDGCREIVCPSCGGSRGMTFTSETCDHKEATSV